MNYKIILIIYTYNLLGDYMKLRYIFLLLLICVPLKIKAYETSASSAILMEQNTNKIIYAKNIHNKRSIASISNIMTI